LVLYAHEGTLAAKLLRAKGFVGIGLISYSAYLWHQPLFAFARIRLLENPSPLLMSVFSLASFLLAYFSWKFIERPFRNTCKRRHRFTFSYSIAGLIAFISIGFTLISNNQFDYLRFPGKPPILDIYSASDSNWASKVRTDSNRICDTLGLAHLNEEVCFTNSKEPELLIVGDSKGMALSSAIFAGYFDVPTLLISAHTCPIYPNLKYMPTHERDWNNNCTEISKRIFNIKKSIPSIDTVIIANHAILSNDEISRYFLNGEKITNNEAMKRGYSSLIEKLLSEELKVIFLTDVPKLKNDALLCIYRDDISGNHCNPTRQEVRQLRQDYYKNIDFLSNELSVQVIDSLEVLCPTELCISYDNGSLLYFDKTHLTPLGARKVLNYIFKQLTLVP